MAVSSPCDLGVFTSHLAADTAHKGSDQSALIWSSVWRHLDYLAQDSFFPFFLGVWYGDPGTWTELAWHIPNSGSRQDVVQNKLLARIDNLHERHFVEEEDEQEGHCSVTGWAGERPLSSNVGFEGSQHLSPAAENFFHCILSIGCSSMNGGSSQDDMPWLRAEQWHHQATQQLPICFCACPDFSMPHQMPVGQRWHLGLSTVWGHHLHGPFPSAAHLH